MGSRDYKFLNHYCCSLLVSAVLKNLSTECGKKVTPEVFRCFLSNRLEFYFKVSQFYLQNILHLTAKSNVILLKNNEVKNCLT